MSLPCFQCPPISSAPNTNPYGSRESWICRTALVLKSRFQCLHTLQWPAWVSLMQFWFTINVVMPLLTVATFTLKTALLETKYYMIMLHKHTDLYKCAPSFSPKNMKACTPALLLVSVLNHHMPLACSCVSYDWLLPRSCLWVCSFPLPAWNVLLPHSTYVNLTHLPKLCSSPTAMKLPLSTSTHTDVFLL